MKELQSELAAGFETADICCRYGASESLRTDHGRGFDNEVVANLAELLRINHYLSTPYYPQSNGLVERLVQTFKSALKRSIQDQLAGAEGESDYPSPYWSHLVPSMLYACHPPIPPWVGFLPLSSQSPFPFPVPVSTISHVCSWTHKSGKSL